MDECAKEHLIDADRHEDRMGYAALAQRHYRHVFALCLGILANVHDAEDVAQETMLKGLGNFRNLARPEQFESWILRIAKNLSVDLLRRRKRAKAALAARETRPGPETDEDHDLECALRRLPAELRLPLMMYYFEHKNARTVAETLGISHSSACQRIREARRQLHELLTERGRYE